MAKLNITEIKHKVITLELSIPEAKALNLVLSSVGGSPKTTARKYIQNILNELDTIIKFSFSDHYAVNGTVYFTNETLSLVENNENINL